MNPWKELQTSFALPQEQLKSALCRIAHFENGEVKDLRGHENDVLKWLESKGIRAHQAYHAANQKKTVYANQYRETRLETKWRVAVEIKSRLTVAFPERSPEQLRKMVRKVGRFEYGEIKKLDSDEIAVREILLKYQIKAATAYQWLLQSIAPQDVREKLENGTLSHIQANRAIQNRERQRRAALELTLLEQARSIVRQVLA